MDAIELKNIQDRIKFDAPSMARCLGIKYDLYRHYRSGHTKIPDDIERKALELESIDQQFMVNRYQPGGALDAEISRQYPQGIMSDVDAWA